MIDLRHPDRFVTRHLGPRPGDLPAMLEAVKAPSLDALIEQTVPESIRLQKCLNLPPARGEHEVLAYIRSVGEKNKIFRSLLGMGYADCITPPVIQRNILENPGWYTQYTPYQAEIAQGRLEALLNFQTMVSDLTALEVANASLLDEATAAAEAMHLMYEAKGGPDRNMLFVARDVHPQTLAVLRTRSEAIGVDLVVGDPLSFDFTTPIFGAVLQYPTTEGAVVDYRSFIVRSHEAGALVTLATDLLSLLLLMPPGELGADVAVGNSQRFGVPLGYGGPHAAFLATRSEHVRRLPGRIIGVSVDAQGKPALRMALQTREQHIRREKATSNICTAQALLAIIAGMYAVYHGPEGLRAIARRVHGAAVVLARGAERLGLRVRHARFFDTVVVEGTPEQLASWHERAHSASINLRPLDGAVAIALDELTDAEELDTLLQILAGQRPPFSANGLAEELSIDEQAPLTRTSEVLAHPIFHRYRSETELLRYMRRLEGRDLSLAFGMIPLGSCTMKLNATVQMMPITWPQWNKLHPFAPREQAQGYQEVFRQLEAMLAEVTGFAATSLQPNAGSQGEYAGLLVIRAYHRSRGQGHRDICLIPSSAHGTNPASAVMAGMKVVVIRCDDRGNIDLADLEANARHHKDQLAALMVTYPSTHGVFEEDIKAMCALVHEYGGQVYMDGANMNAQVGLCRPGDIGADVCHLNLHKTMAIPHGGGGPGMGPICVAAHLAPFLPGHPVVSVGGAQGIGPVSAAPWGSPSILLISWAYLLLLGAEGVTEATKVAILNANYIASRLEPHYPIFYKGKNGRVAHECILDMRHFKASAGVEVDDIAKRLMDYGFHAPTMSFPIPATMMVEPTESESKEELDRFIEAMIAIREEIRAIEEGKMPRENNPLKNAPHTAEVLTGPWDRPYSRELAAFPTRATRDRKFWPAVGRVNNAQGDRKLVCTCPPVEDYSRLRNLLEPLSGSPLPWFAHRDTERPC
ncbi:MAG: aminomethyl-transferring glycine dehydrogenase [Myxococcales bacterium]|nr:aminomethyl-transferring glycine dehydrogenase [Polyangiaceae bacterium]MDW8248004.1 aminomethyl-transferring glycine dehydrogenase [Myxococcales bacterium]